MQHSAKIDTSSRAPFATGGWLRHRSLEVSVAVAAACVAAAIVWMSVRSAHRVNHVALEAAPRPVTVVPAASAAYRDTRTYVGSTQPWVEASVGPQYISAYVLTVAVRPGAAVKQGQVLATLDCSNPNAATRSIEMQARAVDARRHAAEDEAARLTLMLDGGFVAPNDVEQKNAVSLSENAHLLETQANLLRSSLDVRDCVLRAPFDGEIGTRTFDPGAFVHPGASIVSVVDREKVRITVDASEKDFDALAPGASVRVDVLATGAHIVAPIARLSPRADPKTRTVHFEVDIADPKRQYPVETTAIVHVDVGASLPATSVPLYVATQDEGKAKLFVVVDEVAHARTLPVLGEAGGRLFFAPSTLPAGTLVVTEGRSLLSEGDVVHARVENELPAGEGGDAGVREPRGGGFGRSL